MATARGGRLSVSQARSLLASGFKALEERKQQVNDLNVYPVPDGDTGTNLSLTLRAVVESLTRLPEKAEPSEVAKAIAQAALMGARGNSGVILSQIIRGAMDVLAEAKAVGSKELAQALHEATETAYRAVRKPVEGTMLTVIREMAEAAAKLAGELDAAALMDRVIAAGWESVERTPSLLKVLADAGVVDAGGYGLVVVIEGAANGSGDWEVPIAATIEQAAGSGSVLVEDSHEEEESEFTYCCSFFLAGEGLEQAELEAEFGKAGDSLLVVGGDGQYKVHVHTDEPGHVLTEATARGVLSEIEIDNMKEQTAARARRLEQAAAAETGSEDAELRTQVVAVVAGEGNKELFRSLGVDLLVEGGQSMNPSAEDLLQAIESARTDSVVVLPNNGNIIMTAEQTVGLTKREVHVVHSRSIQGGLSAAVVYDRRAGAAENAEEMTAVLERVIVGEVTRAVRDSQVDGVEVKADDFIGLVEGKVVETSSDLGEIIDLVVARLLKDGRVLLTALLGDGESAEEARTAIARVGERYPKVEIEMHEGGQPFYPVLLAAE